MWTFESKFFGLQMQIPNGWIVQTWTDDGMEQFARDASSWKPSESTNMCFQAVRNLVSALLYAPGSCAVSDAGIELQACVHTDEIFLQKPLKKWNLNGIEILYRDDFRPGSPENNHYRFPRWKIGKGLWLYASIRASGKKRFDYVLSVFETLAPIGSAQQSKKKPLFNRKPWNLPPSLFRLKNAIDDNRPLFDLTIDADVSQQKLDTNNAILSGNASPKKWTTLKMRRKSRVLRSDCYYGPQELYSSGIFSERAIESFRPYLSEYFSELSCTVNGKPHCFLCPKKKQSCLDVDASEIKRFDHGGIMEIKRYRFKKVFVSDPLIFAIPEERLGVFATQSIPSKVQQAGLKGIAFHPLDGTGREHTCPG